MLELKKMKLISQGGQADIYELDENKVLRVLRNQDDKPNLKTEMSVMQTLKKNGLTVPCIYDYLEVEGMPALIMERLNGPSLLALMKKQPLKLKYYTKLLAKIQLELAAASQNIELISLHDRAAYLIPLSKELDTKLKAFALDILSEMPRARDLCHGDFHPGNILKSGGKYYTIDWFGATFGDILSDAAHTYLIMRNTPSLPGNSKSQSKLLSFFASLISQTYLKLFYKYHPFDWATFSKWLLVRAAERLSYGQSSEKPALIEFITYCKSARDNGISTDQWWKYL